MNIYLRKAILVCLWTVLMLWPSIAPSQTSSIFDQINKKTKGTDQVESQKEKPPWKKVKREIPPEGTQSQPKTQSQQEVQSQSERQAGPEENP